MVSVANIAPQASSTSFILLCDEFCRQRKLSGSVTFNIC